MSRSKLHKKSLKDYQDGGYRARPRYIPLNIGLEVGNFNLGDVANFAGNVAGLFSGKDRDGDGLKDGFFRDGRRKRAIQKRNAGNYYNYEVNIDENDPNDYNLAQSDAVELFNASKSGDNMTPIRTDDQYVEDIDKFTKYNVDKQGRTRQFIASRKSDANILSDDELKLYKDGMNQQEIANTVAEAFSGFKLPFKHGGENYSGLLPYVKGYKCPEDKMSLLSKITPKAQFGGTLDFNPYTDDFGEYIQGQAQTDYMRDTQSIIPPRQQRSASSDDFEVPEGTIMLDEVVVTPYDAPEVKRTNNIEGGINRLMDSRFMEGYGELSQLAVQGAGIINDYFLDKKAIDAKKEMRELTMADNAFGVYEDPMGKRGLYDANTGLMQPDMSVTTSYGQDGGEVEVDDKTLTRLLASGADIEIL